MQHPFIDCINRYLIMHFLKHVLAIVASLLLLTGNAMASPATTEAEGEIGMVAYN